MVRRALPFILSACAVACASNGAPDEQNESERIGHTSEALAAACTANVAGAMVDVEKTYLPDVVHCENGGAPLESLKAQAIAARTYLYYKLETSGSIGDGQGDQVYTCGSHAGAIEKQAVAETAGQVLRYSGVTIASFYVAGGVSNPPACHDGASSTSADVTYNAGKSGTAITQTPLGFVSPSNTRNRGCMSQLGSRCLANQGKKDDAILKFYYGDDITIATAIGPCVPVTSKPDGGADASEGDASVETPVDPGPDAEPNGGATTYLAPLPAADQDSGCSVATPQRTPPSSFAWLVFALGVVALRRRAR